MRERGRVYYSRDSSYTEAALPEMKPGGRAERVSLNRCLKRNVQEEKMNMTN